jgi:hypothetical protein
MIVKGFDDVFTSKSPALSGIKKELGDIHAKAILTIILIDLVKFFNIGKSMNDEQVGQTIQLIQDEFWMLKPEDFKLCFNNAKKGLYGKVYDRLDGQIILEWLGKYLNERMNYSEQESIRRYDIDKKQVEIERHQHLQQDKEKNKKLHNAKIEHYIKNIQKK